MGAVALLLCVPRRKAIAERDPSYEDRFRYGCGGSDCSFACRSRIVLCIVRNFASVSSAYVARISAARS